MLKILNKGRVYITRSVNFHVDPDNRVIMESQCINSISSNSSAIKITPVDTGALFSYDLILGPVRPLLLDVLFWVLRI